MFLRSGFSDGTILEPKIVAKKFKNNLFCVFLMKE